MLSGCLGLTLKALLWRWCIAHPGQGRGRLALVSDRVCSHPCVSCTHSPKAWKGAGAQKGTGGTQEIRNLFFLSKANNSLLWKILRWTELIQEIQNGCILILFLFSLKEEVLRENVRIHTDKKRIKGKSLSFSKWFQVSWGRGNFFPGNIQMGSPDHCEWIWGILEDGNSVGSLENCKIGDLEIFEWGKTALSSLSYTMVGLTAEAGQESRVNY